MTDVYILILPGTCQSELGVREWGVRDKLSAPATAVKLFLTHVDCCRELLLLLLGGVCPSGAGQQLVDDHIVLLYSCC